MPRIPGRPSPFQPPAPGWAEYAQERREHFKAKEVAEADLRRQVAVDKKALEALNRADRESAFSNRSWVGKGAALNVRRSTIAASHAASRAEMVDGHERARGQLRRRFRPFPDFDAWRRAKGRDEEAAAAWSDAQSAPPEIHGEGEQTARPRDIRSFTPVVHAGAVHYIRVGTTDGAAAFVDRGRKVEIYDWRDPDSLKAALQLSAEKWPGGFVVTGNDEYLRACVRLAAEHGFKIDNPDLRDEIAKERERLREARAQAKTSFQLGSFEKYAAAVGADRYRITMERRREEGRNTIFVVDSKGEGGSGLTPDLIPQHIPTMLAHQRRGDGIFYTPISDDVHHIVTLPSFSVSLG